MLRAVRPLAGVKRDLHPVELGEDVVREVEAPVGADVALDPAQDAERGERRVGRLDLDRLAAQVVGVEAGHDLDTLRVIADRQVVVPSVAGGLGHLPHAGAAVRPRRVAVQVAADVRFVDEAFRWWRRRELTQLRGNRVEAQEGVDVIFGGGLRQRPEPGDVRLRPGRLHERRPEPLRRSDDELDRDPFEAHADVRREHRDDLRQRGEPRPDRIRAGGRYDHGQPLGPVGPPAHVARDDASQRFGHCVGEGARPVERGACPRRRRRGRERGHDPPLVVWADARDGLQAARLGGGAQLRDRADPKRRTDSSEPARPEPVHPPKGRKLGRDRPPQVVQLGDPARLHELAHAPLQAGPDAAQLSDPAFTDELCDRKRRPPDEPGAAPECAHGMAARAGELEQHRVLGERRSDLLVRRRRVHAARA